MPRTKPDWLKIRPPAGENHATIKKRLRRLGLYTVCEEAQCPNTAECWSGGTATFMLMGEICSRACGFCSVTSGKTFPLDKEEPGKVAEAVLAMELDYVVLTSVNRDELPDGGAGHFAEAISTIRQVIPGILIEVLIPDFRGDHEALDKIAEAGPEVTGHNVETVRRLSPTVRDARASFEQSLDVLKYLKESRPEHLTKSSLMLGLGEREAEVLGAMEALRENQVDIVTLGQYLQPTKKHLPVIEYVKPEQFDFYKQKAEAMGFVYAASGPLVRSSYRAGEYFIKHYMKTQKENEKTWPQSLSA